MAYLPSNVRDNPKVKTIVHGWKSERSESVAHYWKGNSSLPTVISACGIVSRVDKLDDDIEVSRCPACLALHQAGLRR